ncbi:DUF58 domain-containing protein [Mycolicibacterium thermoresistibile]
MGRYLSEAKKHFGTDTRGLLEGGHYALLHTRSMEFDDLRPYVPGDDVRDIDWKASARSGAILIKRFVSEKHHKVLVVADAGRNMTASAPSGQRKCDVALHIMGALGLITMRRSDQLGMVYGDARGCVHVRQSRGETHIESMLHRYHDHVSGRPGPSDIVCQLDYVATHYRHSMLIVVVSDEPEPDPRLAAALTRLTARHDLMWAMVADRPAVSSTTAAQDGYDVGTGGIVLNGAVLGAKVINAYRRAERARVQRLAEFMTTRTVPYTVIGGSRDIRRKLVALTEGLTRAG